MEAKLYVPDASQAERIIPRHALEGIFAVGADITAIRAKLNNPETARGLTQHKIGELTKTLQHLYQRQERFAQTGK